jgi:hypothetical protein
MVKIYKDNLPPDAILSDDLKQRAEFFMEAQFLGIKYYIPITKKSKKALGISSIKNLEGSFKKSNQLEGLFQDLIAAVYLQIRDTVGAEIKHELSRDIKNSFEKIFSDRLGLIIEQKFEQKQITRKE